MNTYVQLADYGALLNLLPICVADTEAGEKSTIVTTKPYADLLEGVSYVEHQVVNCKPFEMDKALEWVGQNCKGQVICTQVNGPKELVQAFTYRPAGQKSAVTTSWQKEMWKVAGRLPQWDECLPLKFDRRDPVRETRLWREVFPSKNPGKKPIMLLALNGKSSPFPHKDLLRHLLKTTFGDRWRIIELPQAVRLFDLLAFYEKAALLVAVDSAPLHLAWTVRSLPVIALANDKPLLWNGSSWRPNMVWYCRYGDWLDRWQEMVDAISNHFVPIPAHELLVWSEYENRRNHNPMDCRFDLPIFIGACGRDSAGILKDLKRVPYLRDCIRMAIQKSKPGDRFGLTRPDIGIDHYAMPEGNVAAYAYRMQEVAGGKDDFAPICDLFTAPREWWQAALPEIPDLLLGSDYWWSQCLWALFRRRGAVDITGACCRALSTPAPRSTYEPAPRIKHNVNLWEKYAADNAVFARYPAVTEQVETLPLNTAGLFPGGYNPAIIEHAGKVLLAYRYHQTTLATTLALAQIGLNGVVLSNDPLLSGIPSFEDPKFFVRSGELWISFVKSQWPSNHPTCVVGIGRVVNPSGERPIIPSLPGNDGESMQKNAVFFERDGDLYCLWHCSPTQQIFRVDGENVSKPLETEGPRWPYGQIKGGTPPLEYDGKLLRFFHSTLDNEFAFPHPLAVYRRYFLGACLLDPTPPFKVVAVSNRPIVYGYEFPAPTPSPFHFKPRVVFPGGAIAGDGYFTVAVGINDCQCALLKITPKDLHL